MKDRILFAIAVLALLAFVAELARCQTRPAPAQIVFPQQVRVAGDGRPATLIDSRQVEDGRYVDAPSWLSDPADAGKATVCLVSWLSYTVESRPIRVLKSVNCYTQAGLKLLLADPAWLQWWNAQPTP